MESHIARSSTLPIAASFLLAAAASFLLAAQASPQETSATRLQLSITDSLGKPIEGAFIAVNGRAETRSTGPLGQIVVNASTRDSLNVLVRAVGYRSSTLRLPAGWGASGTFHVVLTKLVTQLPEVIVSGRNGVPDKYRGIARMEGFYDRKARGRGYFITRDMLDRALVPDIEGILAQFPIRGLRSNLSFVRCSNRGDKVNVYVNGSRVPVRDPREALLTLHPLNIEAIEVYRSISEIPPEFLDDNCAAIVLWTRVN